MKIKISIILLLVGAFFLCTVIPVHATLIGFYNISGNDVDDAAIGEDQLWVDVTDPGAGQVLFTFGNTGLEDCSIADVYFDDGTLLKLASLIDADENGGDSGVDFSQDKTSPGNLPAGESIYPFFVTTAGFLADSDSPVQPNGVNPGETLGVMFSLQGSQTYNDTIAALGDGSLRIGIHVQGFASGGSESFVNTVPDASIMFLLAPSLIALALFSRKKSRKKLNISQYRGWKLGSYEAFQLS
ncbi:MAG: hypothetical protein JRE27_11230, partial [Deltaproteobacteria bacterium]|nr:hypothetical protein [Deltaproteobacteria bacterium]